MAKRQRPRQSDLYDFTLDLHGMFADEAMSLVRSFINGHAGTGKSLLVIHGNGSGVLSARVHGALSPSTPASHEPFFREETCATKFDGVTVIYL